MQIHYQEKTLDLPDKSSALDLAKKLQLTGPDQALAIDLNGETRDLNTPLSDGDRIKFWDFNTAEGKKVFWHTSAHVLAQAVLRLYPDALPTIGPPIENGFYYDFAKLKVTEEDLPKIEKEVKKILSEKLKPAKRVFKDKPEAEAAFADNKYKKELIDSFPDDSPITGYGQGEFFDLCRGPHLPTLAKIKGFKLLKVSGAYWRGDSKREMLTRIYGISFPSREALKDYLYQLEEAKKRDHRLLGTRLDLFSFREEAPGMPFIHPKGMLIWDQLIAYWQDVHRLANYQVIKTPQLMSRELWERSGHWDHYRENMFTCFSRDEREFAVKPMNCPGCMLYYKSRTHSYRELPLRIAEFGHVHRREPSGAINGLFRVQSFHQDDAHLFMAPTDIKKEILEVLKLVQQIYQTFGLKYTFELSTRPEQSIGTDADWEIATKGLKEALDEWEKPYQVNPGDGAFYGPKIDLHVHDALGRSWQCGTIQLDMALPEKFDLEYKDRDGELKRPIMIHRAIFGSIERFLGILIEHFAAKFPLWLSPNPIRIIPVTDNHLTYALKVEAQLKAAGFNAVVDTSTESLGKKVRTAQLLQTNYMLTLGNRELENQTLSLRTRDNVVHGEVNLNEFLSKIQKEKANRELSSPYQKVADTSSLPKVC
ncbi:MAG: threonine--tRNA ligase [Chlamydiota bacterium]